MKVVGVRWSGIPSTFCPTSHNNSARVVRQMFTRPCLVLSHAMQFLPTDLNFIKTPRSIRTPFRNTEIMTARGFGKRDGEEQEYVDSEFGLIDSTRHLIYGAFRFQSEHQISKSPTITETRTTTISLSRNNFYFLSIIK